MTGDHGAWVATLDAFEARLEASRTAAATGELAHPAPFEPPLGLGPIPDDLVARAAELLSRSRELEALITKARAAIAAKLAQPATQPAPAPRRASRLDVSV